MSHREFETEVCDTDGNDKQKPAIESKRLNDHSNLISIASSLS
jgi:hypothetical protein